MSNAPKKAAYVSKRPKGWRAERHAKRMERKAAKRKRWEQRRKAMGFGA